MDIKHNVLPSPSLSLSVSLSSLALTLYGTAIVFPFQVPVSSRGIARNLFADELEVVLLVLIVADRVSASKSSGKSAL